MYGWWCGCVVVGWMLVTEMMGWMALVWCYTLHRAEPYPGPRPWANL